ncbi:MAG: AraC family transcriptional regulator [Verrucomicrobia bacterium]|nr:MAG: AraC family transcriptional regulator [Verrucomicrobiota bacterium]
MSKYFVDFRGHDALEMLRRIGLQPGSCVGVRSASRLATIWEELLSFGTHPHMLARRGAVLSLELIMIVIAQERVELGGTGGARATIDRCQAFMQENFLNVRTVEGVAEACRLDVAYMCRLYRRFLGETPYRVLQRLQMAWAAEQLLQPGRLVREVADQLELDPFQFSRTFKRVYGVSPTEFIRLRSHN